MIYIIVSICNGQTNFTEKTKLWNSFTLAKLMQTSGVKFLFYSNLCMLRIKFLILGSESTTLRQG